VTLDRRRWQILGVLALVQFLIVIDNTIVNVALPSIEHDLGFTADGLAWVVNGYLLAAGGLLLLGGRLADLLGRRRLFLTGTVIFAAASLLCGLATTPGVLVASRFAQGVGEALAAPAALSLIALLFPEPAERGKALGVWGGLAGLGAVTGVLLSGTLTYLLDWRWIFFINLPFAVVALILAPRLIPRDLRGSRAGSLDLPGAVLVTGGATAVVFGLLASVRQGWSDPTVIASMVVGALAFVALVAVERRARAPLVPLRFFANRTRVGANAAAVFLVGVMAALFLLLTLFMQQVLGYSALSAGLAYVPFCLLFVGAVFGAFVLVARWGVRATLLIAFGAAAVGMLLLSRLPVDASYGTDLLPALLVLAVGFGLGFPCLQTAALHEVSEDDAGLGAGMQTTVQALANALGVAVFLAVALHRTGGAATAEAITAGYRLAFVAGVASLLLGAVIVLLMIERRVGISAVGPLPESRLEAETRVGG
jgi:EmrB/QacA subfamily drug resistance transporter